MKFIVNVLAALGLFVSLNASAQYTNQNYPVGPNPAMTPGSLCDRPNAFRYPEHIAYCNRDVDSDTKRAIIRLYDEKFGYRIQQMDRGQFKIDHYIPLCAGGSNHIDNLWPQHQSVYAITDIMEQRVCEKMAQGRLSQSDAIQLIRAGKNDLSKVDAILDHLNTL